MLWLDLVLALSCSAGGVVCGWILYSAGASDVTQRSDHDTEANLSFQQEISVVADRLREYAVSISADVDAHQERVMQVNESLASHEDAEGVLSSVEQLLSANKQMQDQLNCAQRQIDKQAQQIESAELRARTDALTGIANRRAFDEHLSRRQDFGLAKAGFLAILDVDFFKKFNDEHGHRAGDEVLRVVAKVLDTELGTKGLVARFGGEEFAVFIDGGTIDEAIEQIEQARQRIGSREIRFEGKVLKVTASMGVAQQDADESTEDWLQRADDGLYQSKDAGRDCGHWMDGKTPQRIGSAGDAADSGSEPDAGDKPVDADDQPSGKSLLDVEGVRAEFEQLQETSAGEHLSLMAIRAATPQDEAGIELLENAIRSCMRLEDQLGRQDDQTLLLIMPSVEEDAARDCGQQICQSAASLEFDGPESPDGGLTIGLATAGSGERFDEVLSAINKLADPTETLSEEPIRVASTSDAVA